MKTVRDSRQTRKDADLVAGAIQGDTAAFDSLLRRHRERLILLARQITGDWEAAEEVAQEAFLAAFRALPALRDGQRFGPWLRTIGRRAAQRHLRERLEHPVEPVEPATFGAMGFLGPAEPGHDSDVAERIRSALGTLSQRNRRILILHYLEGYECHEISERMGIPVGSVKRILFDSRTQIRKELGIMTITKAPGGPRRLIHWVYGSPGRDSRNALTKPDTLLAETVCLCVNKEAKTAKQIASEIGAHQDYVADMAEDLLGEEILSSPRRGKYRTNFIAFDAADWKTLSASVPKAGPAVFERFERSVGLLRQAYTRTPLAASCPWEQAVWPVAAVLTLNIGLSRNGPKELRASQPPRPGGGRYWLGGYEEVPGLRSLWCTGFNCTYGPEVSLSHGHFWSYGLHRPSRLFSGRPLDALAALADGPLPVHQVVARLAGDAETARASIADLIASGFILKENGSLRLTFPVFGEEESDLLTPTIDQAVQPLLNEVLLPELGGVDKLLDRLGYGHLRDQYPPWNLWLLGNMAAEGLRLLMEREVLPRPTQPAPPTFAFFAWKGDLPLMNWGP